MVEKPNGDGSDSSDSRKETIRQLSDSFEKKSVTDELNKLRRMSKRRFLEHMAALGVSSTALAGLTKEAVAENTDNPDDQVIRLFGYHYKDKKPPEPGQEVEREPAYYSIPRDQWVRTECSNAAAKRLERRFSEEGYAFGVSSIDGEACIVAKHLTYESDSERGTNESYQRFESDVPYKVDQKIRRNGREYSAENIPVIRRKESLEEQAYFDKKYRAVPGGCAAGDDYDGTRGNEWSIGHPAYCSDIFDSVLVTASHCIDRTSNNSVYQPSDYSSNKIGESFRYTPSGDGDVASIQMESGTSVEYDIAAYKSNSNDYMGWNVVGTVSGSQLDDMAANNEYAYQQGRRTGRCYGVVDDHYHKTRDSGPKVRIVCDTKGGDSGGPYFILDENYNAWRVGIHAWGSSTDDGKEAGSGNTFYYAEQELGVE